MNLNVPLTDEQWTELQTRAQIRGVSPEAVLQDYVQGLVNSTNAVEAQMELNRLLGDSKATPDASENSNPRIGLYSNPVSYEDFAQRAPDRLELYRGYPGGCMTEAVNLLDLCLEAFGLDAVVKRAPIKLWLLALHKACK